MSKKELQDQADPQRREFLKTLTVAGGAAAVAATGSVSAATEEVTEKEETESKGYRETQHIRDYYKSARI